MLDGALTDFLLNVFFTSVVLIAGFVITGVFTSRYLHIQFYDFILTKAKTKRQSLLGICLISGLIPVTQRTSVTAPILDSVIVDDQDKEFQRSSKNAKFSPESNRGKMGILDYISDSLYYLLSPLDKGFLIIMMGLGLSYFQFMQYLIVPILFYVAFLLYIAVYYIGDNDINFISRNSFLYNRVDLIKASPVFIAVPLSFFIPPVVVFSITALYYFLMYKVGFDELKQFIRFRTLVTLLLSAIIVEAIRAVIVPGVTVYTIFGISPFYNELTMLAMLYLSGMVSYMTASRTVYACSVVFFTTVFGLHLLPMIFTISYAGYLLSSKLECVRISASYFQTNMIEMYRIILLATLFLVFGGLISAFVLLY